MQISLSSGPDTELRVLLTQYVLCVMGVNSDMLCDLQDARSFSNSLLLFELLRILTTPKAQCP